MSARKLNYAEAAKRRSEERLRRARIDDATIRQRSAQRCLDRVAGRIRDLESEAAIYREQVLACSAELAALTAEVAQ